MKKSGINLFSQITSKNKELYIIYKIDSSQYIYLENLIKYWDEIVYLIKKKTYCSKDEIKKLEAIFRSKVTGENDMNFIKVRIVEIINWESSNIKGSQFILLIYFLK